MVYAVIAAGGIGTRMGNTEKPKQYITLSGKPIICHTVEKFYVNSEFRRVIVLCPDQWVSYTKNIIAKYLPDAGERVVVIEGGCTRNATLMNAVDYIERTDGLDESTIVVTHDAVRPFVTSRIIRENIDAAREYGACDTVVPATDTIVESEDGDSITLVPDRSTLYQGQTPQSFNALKLRRLYNELTDEEKDILTDACKIFTIKGLPVRLVRGEVYNIKLTYPYDLRVARVLLEEGEEKPAE